jgi:hypothetical protein
MIRETGESQAEGGSRFGPPGTAVGVTVGPGVLARGPGQGSPGPRRPGFDSNEIRPNQIQASI